MKPVIQTITGPRGNCMGACLASILELPMEVVPNFFDAGPDDTDWWNALRAWLRQFGLGIITLTFESPAQWSQLRLGGHHIVSGASPRLEGLQHATVWHAGQMVHDPHPDGTGIVKPETLDMLYLIEPASLQLPASVIAAQLRALGVAPCQSPSGWPSVSEDEETVRAAIQAAQLVPNKDSDAYDALARLVTRAPGVPVRLAGGWGELREGEHFTRNPAPDAAAPMMPSPCETFHFGADGKLAPAPKDGVAIPLKESDRG